MKKKDKQNKNKLKFLYIKNLQSLGKIWKEHKNNNTNTNANDKIQVVNRMNKNTIKKFCSILNECDDILINLRSLDASLKKSHIFFLSCKKIIMKMSK